MEHFGNIRIMVLSPWSILLVLSILAHTVYSRCSHGQYHSESLQRCVNCSVCDSSKGLAVLRPCAVHKDVICIPVHELFQHSNPDGQHRHRHKGKNHHREKAETMKSTENAELVDFVTSTQVPFSSAEALVWDWQAIALTLAVFACILFFLVIALYSLHQAKQWRRLKENFEADVEELSARLSLMAASSSEKGEVLEPNFSAIRDGNYLNNRCVYLEQLLNVRQDKKVGSKGGNVYIEESANGGTVATDSFKK